MTPAPRLAAIVLVLITVLAGGCASGLGQDSDISSEDARMSSQVKVALVREPDLAAAAIDVSVSDGAVILSGFVETDAQRQRAAEAADQVRGVRSVTNEIGVK